MNQTNKYTVGTSFNNYRLDRYIKEQNDEKLYSRSLIDKLILENQVYVNSQVISKKSYPVKSGDVIIVNIPEKTSKLDELPQKENIPLKIVYEDQYLAIVDKPEGLTIHPAPGNYTGTLVNALLYHFTELSKVDNFRPGIVHRLDKDTSGLVIITKDDMTHYKMSQLFMNRKVEKSYLCICLGATEQNSGTINLPIERNKNERKKMATSSTGKSAISHYHKLLDFEYFSLLEVKIETGRTHQIRVHLDAIHHPVLGDKVYNSLKRTLNSCPAKKQSALKQYLSKNVTRQMLHAWKLSFEHPVTQKKVDIKSEIPACMVKTIDFFKENFEYIGDFNEL